MENLWIWSLKQKKTWHSHFFQSCRYSNARKSQKLHHIHTKKKINHKSTPHRYNRAERESADFTPQISHPGCFRKQMEGTWSLGRSKTCFEIPPCVNKIKRPIKKNKYKCLTQNTSEPLRLMTRGLHSTPASAHVPDLSDRHLSFPSGKRSGSIFKRLLLNNDWTTF